MQEVLGDQYAHVVSRKNKCLGLGAPESVRKIAFRDLSFVGVCPTQVKAEKRETFWENVDNNTNR